MAVAHFETLQDISMASKVQISSNKLLLFKQNVPIDLFNALVAALMWFPIVKFKETSLFRHPVEA